MVTMEQGKRSSCGRGVLKFRTWKPLPRPGELPGLHQEKEKNEGADARLREKSINRVPTSNVTSAKDLRMVLVKYSYKANPDRPGGFDELSVKQGDKIYFHCGHPRNPHWVKAETSEGEIGYVPSSYIMELESKPSQLPWLANKKIDREAEIEKQTSQNGAFANLNAEILPAKQYISAYAGQAGTKAANYSCELCGKVFNGPSPYRLHMSSRAHKEEVEAQKYR